MGALRRASASESREEAPADRVCLGSPAGVRRQCAAAGCPARPGAALLHTCVVRADAPPRSGVQSRP
eukprot:9951202-Alexandrium_andersonii.AAC.1